MPRGRKLKKKKAPGSSERDLAEENDELPVIETLIKPSRELRKE